MEYELNVLYASAILIIAPIAGYALFTFFSIVSWAMFDVWNRIEGR